MKSSCLKRAGPNKADIETTTRARGFSEASDMALQTAAVFLVGYGLKQQASGVLAMEPLAAVTAHSRLNGMYLYI